MKESLLKLAVLAALVASSQVQAAAVAVPAAGFASSAYTDCYNAGRTAADPKANFGQVTPIGTIGSAGSDTCWIAKPSTSLVSTLPAAFGTGYTLVGSRSVPITATNNGTTTVGTLNDVAWRNSATSQCVIATAVTMTNADNDSTTAGTQYFEVNDIARGGFSGAGSVNVAYTILGSQSNTAPAYRVGRTFTSVQHRSLKYGNTTDAKVNGTNYLDLPTKNTFTGDINGEGTGILGTVAASTIAANQDAAVNANYVDFTTDAVFVDDDGSLTTISPVVYVQAACTTNPTLQNNAIRLRQTAQENTTPKFINMQGYAISTP